jgi:hypothetical protein
LRLYKHSSAPAREEALSELIKSVDDLVTHDFAFDAFHELRENGFCEIKNPAAATRILEHLIRTSIARARS